MTEQIADLRGNQEETSHAGRIPQTAFIVSRQLHRATIPTPPYHKLHNANTCCCSLHAPISVLFGLAVVATLTRFITRLVSRGRLYLDDFFVLFALVCLRAGTGLMINSYHIVFVDETAATNATVVIARPASCLRCSVRGRRSMRFFCIMWTAIFSIKVFLLGVVQTVDQASVAEPHGLLLVYCHVDLPRMGVFSSAKTLSCALTFGPKCVSGRGSSRAYL